MELILKNIQILKYVLQKHNDLIYNSDSLYLSTLFHFTEI